MARALSSHGIGKHAIVVIASKLGYLTLFADQHSERIAWVGNILVENPGKATVVARPSGLTIESVDKSSEKGEFVVE